MKIFQKYYLGLDVGGTSFVAGVVDENYNIIAKERISAKIGSTVDELVYNMADVSKIAVQKAGLSLDDISSWGICMPSNINPKTNLLVHANCFGWKNIPIYDYLKKHIPLPIYIANDANGATYGEILAGSASKYSTALMLTLGTGVGGGIIIDNKIYAGADNMGAELGHTKLVYNGALCTCGQKGCLEAYCSATALIKAANEAVKEQPSSLILSLVKNNENNINGEVICRAAIDGDPLAVRLLDDYTSYLAAGISSLVVIFRPEVIMLGGGIAHAGDLILKPVNEKLRIYTHAGDEIGVPPVVCASLGNDAGIIGAAFLEKIM